MKLWDQVFIDDAPDSKSSILGLSNEVSIVTEYFWKDGEIKERSFPYCESAYIFLHDCMVTIFCIKLNFFFLIM